MSRRYPIAHPKKSGWTAWEPVGSKLNTTRCCDCKLVHEFQVRKRRADDWIEMRWRRNQRKTEASRRALGVRIVTKP